MTIKPPERRPGANPVGPTGARPGAEAPERPGTSFRDKLELPASGPPSATAQAPNAGKIDALGELIEAVRAGKLDREQAIERLIERNLDRVGRGLSATQRSEIATVLREALENDPALRALRDSIG